MFIVLANHGKSVWFSEARDEDVHEVCAYGPFTQQEAEEFAAQVRSGAIELESITGRLLGVNVLPVHGAPIPVESVR